MRIKNILMSAATLALALSLNACGDDDEVIDYSTPEPEENTENPDETPEETPKSVNHFFLCFGQSNMEGNAKPIAKDKECPKNFQSYVCYNGSYDGKSYKVGDLRTATPPLCRSGQAGGVGVTDYFGRTLATMVPEGDNVRVAVVALGGTAIDGFLEDYRQSYLDRLKAENTQWLLGYYKCYSNKPYDRMIEVAKKAISNGDSFDGILFHQGETDGYSAEWNKRVKQVYDNICKDLGVKDVPFLAGQVTSNSNGCINNIPNYIKGSYVIKSNGCESDKKGENGTVALGSDNGIHFNHAGYEEMGKRYAEQMAKIMGLK